MSLSDEFRQIADECRAIPAEFGLREHTVSLVVTTTSTGLPWEAISSETEMPITVHGGVPPKIRFPSQREIALGLMSEGQVVVGPFTPSYGTGGVDRDALNAALLSSGDGFALRITGPQHPNGCLYRIKNANVDRALRVTLTCIPVEGS